MISKIQLFLFCTTIFLLLPNCDNEEDYMPDYVVNVQIDPAALTQIAIGTASYCPYEGGVKGIIIYKESSEQYYAFERLCTYYPNDTSAIVIDDSKTSATCPRCNSCFSLIDGSVLKSPAKYPLKQYRTSVLNNRLYITN